MFKKKWINILVLIIFLLVLFNSVYLYAENGKNSKNSKKVVKNENITNTVDDNTLTKEEKRALVKEKINNIMKKKRLERKLQLKKAEKLKKLREKILNDKIELQSATENMVFPFSLDISDKLKQKSIQERSLSCELAATSDIVSFFKNRKYSEDYIIDLVDKDYYNAYPKKVGDKIVWGNPNAGYVGYIDKLPSGKKATQTLMTGYGVLEKPINKIYKGLGFKTKVITNNNFNYNEKDHLTELLEELSKGNMIQLWGDYCTDPRYEDTFQKNTCKQFYKERKLEWYYEEEGELKKYEGIIGEHAFYLLGYKGGVENPSDIIVWDTNTGKHTYKIKEWLRKWNKMQNRSIIIYKK